MNAKALQTLEKHGFSVPNFSSIEKYENLNGVILKDGTFIQCEGFNQHRFVYPLLHKLKLVDSPDWIQDESAIHVSSSQLSGKVAYDMERASEFEFKQLATDKQLSTLFHLRKQLLGIYGQRDTIGRVLYEYHSKLINYGGKYNGLSFLKRFYKNIRTPKFCKHVKDVDWSKSVCIRTSPIYSLPGLLNSKFDVKFSNYKKAITEIRNDYKRFADLIADNSLHYFFQEQLQGINGVCHVRGREKSFSYSASETRGDIVRGKRGQSRLNEKIVKELHSLAIDLHEDFDKSIQLEFVVSKGKLYIVQFRLLHNEPEETLLQYSEPPENVICSGVTFSFGKIDVNTNDILVVKNDGDSSLLIGKKALIVTDNVEFSHLLALSKALRIPSMYNTGKVILPANKIVKFISYNKKAWIQ